MTIPPRIPSTWASQPPGDLALHRVQAQTLLHHLDEDRLVLGREDQDLQQRLQGQVEGLDALLVLSQATDELLDPVVLLRVEQGQLGLLPQPAEVSQAGLEPQP